MGMEQGDLDDRSKNLVRIRRMPRTPSSKSTVTKKKKKKIVAKRKPAAVKRKVATVATPKPEIVVVQPTPRRNYHLGMQLAIAGSAIVVLLLLAAVENNIFSTKGGDAAALPITIGLEHSGPLSLSVLFAKKDTAGYVSLRNNSHDDIHISVPSNWVKSEVTGTDIRNVTQDIPTFGFTRYALPAGAGVKMLMPESPDAVLFDSTSQAVTALDLKTIDLTTSKVMSTVILLQKQTLISLWTNVR
jgi:hypothetical protein